MGHSEIIFLSLVKHRLRIEIGKRDQTVLDAKCDILLFNKRVHSLLSKLITDMYCACPDLVGYDLLNPALYSAFKQNWIENK